MESLRNPSLSVELIRGCYLKKGANLPRLWHRSGKAAEHVAEAPVATCPPHTSRPPHSSTVVAKRRCRSALETLVGM